MTGPENSEGGPSDDGWFTYRMDPGERPTEAVVMAVAAVKNVPVLNLEQLARSVNTDALDALFSDSKEDQRNNRVRFTYADCVVEVTNTIVRVQEQG